MVAVMVLALTTTTLETCGVGPVPFCRATAAPAANPEPDIVTFTELPACTELGVMPVTVTSAGGGDALTVTETDALPVKPPLSVTDAVIVCVPTLSVREKLPPVPICPSRLDVHTRLAVRFPSCVSLAEPENEIVAPSAKVEPLAGLLIVTLGAVLGGGPDEESMDTPK